MSWKFWKKKKPSHDLAFEFWSVFDPLNDERLNHLWPQPASQFFPEWFKNVPRNIDNDINKPTIRKCPIFPEFMTQGYIIPLWCDFNIHIKQDGSWTWESATPGNYGWEWHHPDQYLNWLPDHEQDKWCLSLKAENPWRVKTPEGWSCYQHSPLYHFNEVQPLSGSIRTDISHEINVPVVFPKHMLGTTVTLKRGDPFVWLIPYRREKLDLVKRDYDEETQRMTAAAHYNTMSKFNNGYKIAGQKSDKKS